MGHPVRTQDLKTVFVFLKNKMVPFMQPKILTGIISHDGKS